MELIVNAAHVTLKGPAQPVDQCTCSTGDYCLESNNAYKVGIGRDIISFSFRHPYLDNQLSLANKCLAPHSPQALGGFGEVSFSVDPGVSEPWTKSFIWI